MNKVDFYISGSITRAHDAAVVLVGEEPIEAMIEAAIQTVSTDIIIDCGGVEMHLAGWQDPDHWSDDWQGLGIDPDDVPGLVAAQVVSDG